jgi:hypothetical protein
MMDLVVLWCCMYRAGHVPDCHGVGQQQQRVQQVCGRDVMAAVPHQDDKKAVPESWQQGQA